MWVSARTGGKLGFHHDFAHIEFRLDVSHGFGGAARTALRCWDRLRANSASARWARREIIVRVIDFHSVGSFELEQVLRQLERDETRGSLRRAGRSDRTNLEASVFSVDTQRFGGVYAIPGNLAVGRVPEDWQ